MVLGFLAVSYTAVGRECRHGVTWRAAVLWSRVLVAVLCWDFALRGLALAAGGGEAAEGWRGTLFVPLGVLPLLCLRVRDHGSGAVIDAAAFSLLLVSAIAFVVHHRRGAVASLAAGGSLGGTCIVGAGGSWVLLALLGVWAGVSSGTPDAAGGALVALRGMGAAALVLLLAVFRHGGVVWHVMVGHGGGAGMAGPHVFWFHELGMLLSLAALSASESCSCAQALWALLWAVDCDAGAGCSAESERMRFVAVFERLAFGVGTCIGVGAVAGDAVFLWAVAGASAALAVCLLLAVVGGGGGGVAEPPVEPAMVVGTRGAFGLPPRGVQSGSLAELRLGLAFRGVPLGSAPRR